MPKRAVKAIKATIKELSQINKLKAEIELLTHCSSDTVYRLRYDTMQYDYISPSVVQLLGYSTEELMRINLRSLIIETRIVNEGMRAVESYSGLEETRKRGEVHKWQADYLIKTREGKEIWVSDVSYPWFDNRGAIIGSIGNLRDITDRIRAEEKIREELLGVANNDPLTGLANRQLFWCRLEDEIRRLRRTNGDLALLLIEVDQFQKINEVYGQAMGDGVLSGIAKLLRGCLRDIDVAARLSGEEFGVILPETRSEGAVLVAQRICDAVARHTFFAGSHNKPVGYTVSLGVAGTKFGQNTDATSLYKLADTRLYIAKHTGEGQISADEMAGNVH
jgi:diguanylate cyclase (GGDEF)-like protein/PAS domain S-box-containing protein